MWNVKAMVQMTLFIKRKQTHRKKKKTHRCRYINTGNKFMGTKGERREGRIN